MAQNCAVTRDEQGSFQTLINRLHAENRDLRLRLSEAEDTLNAIRGGQVDAVIVSSDTGARERLFTLEGSDASYKALIESMSEGALVLTNDGRIYYANRSMGEMLQTPHQELPGTAFKQWIKSEDHPWFDSLLRLRQEAPPEWRSNEVFLLARDGSEKPCHLSISMLPVNEQHVYFSLVATDLTEQKAHQDRILAAERLARSILDQAAEAIVVCDRTTRILRANALARQLSASSPLGKLFTDALPLQLPSGTAFDLQQYITHRDCHPFEAELTLAGERMSLLVGLGPWLGSDGEMLGSIVTLTDINERKAAEEKIFHLAFYDPLTSLPNRRLLEEHVNRQHSQYARNGRHGALAFIDLDNFKTLNDTRGHDIGDLLLQQVAARITGMIREYDTLARLGGDEFVLILVDLDENLAEAAIQAERICAKILRSAQEPYLLDEHECRATFSIGITLFGPEKISLDELLKQADLAMYQSKASGRNTWRFFAPAMQQKLETRARLEERLRLALRDERLHLAFQPQIDRDQRIIGAEALLRWHDDEEGDIPPSVFIPLAEETGLILPLGDWVLDQACAQLARWAGQPRTATLTLAVNVSAHQFHQPDFVEHIRAVLSRHGITPERLKLELTETLLVKDVKDAAAKMEALKALGISFSLDDFGTGYSSLAYLKRLPLDQLKIDQSFVHDLLENSSDAAIVDAIISMARNLGLAVIAEGVETVAQHSFLLKHGCDAFQGFLFGRPGPAEGLATA
ncbi:MULTISPECIES: sensor domain-containing protein [Thiorhodovibrio]|uniref:sensor domain-containing protein n=1 Tax=Thiorhodovibrio TaxID=61593 RepID=UPI002B25AC24|nr:EAL domain-containing protein [Thiorhodovibrio litoralis]WPL12708.1 Cyclic di-GMP phosphodiesterase Gmr [Thiorhodovibrio litoralis]